MKLQYVKQCEISYLKNTIAFLIIKFQGFVNSEIPEKEIDQKFNQGVSNIRDDDPFKDARIKSLRNQKAQELDALNTFKKR